MKWLFYFSSNWGAGGASCGPAPQIGFFRIRHCRFLFTYSSPSYGVSSLWGPPSLITIRGLCTFTLMTSITGVLYSFISIVLFSVKIVLSKYKFAHTHFVWRVSELEKQTSGLLNDELLAVLDVYTLLGRSSVELSTTYSVPSLSIGN